MASRALGNVIKNMRVTLREHSATAPLLGACFFSGSMGIFMMFYTSLRKSDVSYNRWTNTQTYNTLKTKADEVLFVTKSSKDGYHYDVTPIQTLLNEVYADGRYMKRLDE